MEFLLLGPIEAHRSDGRPVALGRRRERCLLGLLLLNAGRTVPIDRLVGLLWEGHPPDDPRPALRTYVSRLRAALDRGSPGSRGPRLCGGGSGYAIDADPAAVDAHRFAEQVHRARGETDLDRRARMLAQALALWRGPLLADVASDALRQRIGSELGQLRLSAIQSYVDAELVSGRHDDAIGMLTTAVAVYPTHEPLVDQLMLTLQRSGRPADALVAYQQLRARLADALGTDPDPQLTRRYLAILRQDRTADDPRRASCDSGGETPVTATAAVVAPAQLPSPITDFTGRRDALRELDRAAPTGAGTSGAVVISAVAGTAGVGKTALALHWAHRVADRFPDGQLYVNLRGYDGGEPLSPDTALDGFLRALGVAPAAIPQSRDERSALYRSVLSRRRALVLVDNARSAAQVRPLLPGTPTCLVLVTSRDDLTGLVVRDGARRLTLDPLTEPESLDLLRRIIGQHRVRAEPSAVAELVRACCGLPLALRVIAERATRRPDEPLAGLATGLLHKGRLDALDIPGDPASAVREVFGSSYRALTPAAARLFRRLGLHPGADFSSRAVSRLADHDPTCTDRLLAELTTAHLLERRVAGRYQLHDLLRAYAAERARDEETDADRHAALDRLLGWYCAGADCATRTLCPGMLRLPTAAEVPEVPEVPEATMSFADPSAALAWLDDERANLVAAIDQAAEAGPRSAAWRLFDALRWYLSSQHPDELRRVGRTVLRAARADRDAHAMSLVCMGIGVTAEAQGDPAGAIEQFTESADHARRAGWSEGESCATSNLGLVYLYTGRLDKAAACFERAVAMDEAGQFGRATLYLPSLAYVHLLRGRLHQATECYARVSVASQRTESLQGTAWGLWHRAVFDRYVGRLDYAIDQLASAVRLLGETGDRASEAVVLNDRAAAYRDAGRYLLAVADSDAALALQRTHGDPWQRHDSLVTRGTIHSALGRYPDAIADHREALGAARAMARRGPEVEALIGLAAAFRQQGELDQARDHAACAVATAHRLGYRLYEGMARTELAAVCHHAGDCGSAQAQAEQALAIHHTTGHRLGEARTLLLLGRTAAQAGDHDTARTRWQRAADLCSETGVALPEADEIRALLDSRWPPVTDVHCRVPDAADR